MPIMSIRVLAEERREVWHTTDVPSRGSRASRKPGARLLRGSGDVDDSRAADFQESIASRGR